MNWEALVGREAVLPAHVEACNGLAQPMLYRNAPAGQVSGLVGGVKEAKDPNESIGSLLHIAPQDDRAPSMGLPRALTAIAQPVTRRALGRKRTVLGSLLVAWSDIVGEEMARQAIPERVTLSGGGRESGVLVLRVGSADAMTVSYAAPELLQRINSHFGYRAIAKITLKQSPVGPRPLAPNAGQAKRLPINGGQEIDAQAVEGLSSTLAEVTDPEIRQALERFGRALMSREDSDNH